MPNVRGLSVIVGVIAVMASAAPTAAQKPGGTAALLHLGQPAERLHPRGGDDLDRVPVHAGVQQFSDVRSDQA
jgi:hypothetical protein